MPTGVYKRTPEMKLSMSKARLGMKFSKEHKSNLSKARKLKNSEHPNWKGNDASYSVIHIWVAYHLGKPKVCENCETVEAKKYEWANISGEYMRELSDWVRLCTRCHHLIDDIHNKIWLKRRTN